MGQTCSYILVNEGDTCASLAAECNITAAEFTQYNPSSTLCSTLVPKEPVCCSSGSLPDLTPQPNSDGTCYAYTVQNGDYCQLIASNNYITVDDIETYNAQTWGWMGCDDIQLNATICLSTGTPPMPAVVSGALCGPQVSGTQRPSDWSDIASLNPCPLNACCDIWGQCGTTDTFCTITQSSTGAPGTTNCISNCGTGIANNGTPPAEYLKIGYFEGFNLQRPCLIMSADKIPSGYTHIHFAFGGISSSYAVDMSAVQDQFEIFAQQTSYKRILSFGGWSFSTDTDTYPIFRGGVTAENRLAFANSIVSVIEQYDLDGVDFDWEYPGATDIPGIPPGSPEDGANYLAFLQTMRSVLPSGKTMSIAAPASYWYLRNFPIAQMSEVLDYIVFMTYDLHGQWDYGNPNSQDGCPNGDCLRSHVNITETVNALSMITKAGVASNKIIVGVASYGRSFGMVDPSCTGPTCHYTGPNSTAFPGPCTNTAGYMAQAEILLFNSLQSPTWHDDPSNSDITVLPDGTWISYMSNDTMTYRRDLYYYANFGGTVEWAIDLAAFVEDTATATVTNSATLPTEVVTITFVEPSEVFFVTFTAEESATATNELRQNFIDYVKQKHLE